MPFCTCLAAFAVLLSSELCGYLFALPSNAWHAVAGALKLAERLRRAASSGVVAAGRQVAWAFVWTLLCIATTLCCCQCAYMNTGFDSDPWGVCSCKFNADCQGSARPSLSDTLRVAVFYATPFLVCYLIATAADVELTSDVLLGLYLGPLLLTLLCIAVRANRDPQLSTVQQPLQRITKWTSHENVAGFIALILDAYQVRIFLFHAACFSADDCACLDQRACVSSIGHGDGERHADCSHFPPALVGFLFSVSQLELERSGSFQIYFSLPQIEVAVFVFVLFFFAAALTVALSNGFLQHAMGRRHAMYTEEPFAAIPRGFLLLDALTSSLFLLISTNLLRWLVCDFSSDGNAALHSFADMACWTGEHRAIASLSLIALSAYLLTCNTVGLFILDGQHKLLLLAQLTDVWFSLRRSRGSPRDSLLARIPVDGTRGKIRAGAREFVLRPVSARTADSLRRRRACAVRARAASSAVSINSLDQQRARGDLRVRLLVAARRCTIGRRRAD